MRLVDLVRADLTRHSGGASVRSFAKFFVLSGGFRLAFWFRVFTALHGCRSRTVRHVVLAAWNRLALRFGSDISLVCEIGPGLYFGHVGAVVVSGHAVIGANANLSPGVVIGAEQQPDGTFGGPVIGSNVYIASGAKVLGRVVVGDWVAIGANAVVRRDVPSWSTAVGVPARVIPDRGSAALILNRAIDTP